MPAARALLPGVWELRTFTSATQASPSLERLNLTAFPQPSGGLVLQGVVHAPEGRTWGAEPARELRVEFPSAAAEAGQVLERRAGEGGEWQSLCDFSFRAAGEGVLLSASPACTWALKAGGENASAAREWVLSAAPPHYALQHGTRRPDAGLPATYLQRFGQLLLLPLLLVMQAAFKYFKGRLLGPGGGAAGKAQRRAASGSGAAPPATDAAAERERAARRQALTAATESSAPQALPPTDAAAKRAL
jgi:hypothetical protein